MSVCPLYRGRQAEHN
uniref:Uncharacterized protein n=1 Tax=Anguilla anguilla TaxID=7936 RepID=A0A0E9SSP8_ANGAN